MVEHNVPRKLGSKLIRKVGFSIESTYMLKYNEDLRLPQSGNAC
jgi:hypothetical protein